MTPRKPQTAKGTWTSSQPRGSPRHLASKEATGTPRKPKVQGLRGSHGKPKAPELRGSQRCLASKEAQGTWTPREPEVPGLRGRHRYLASHEANGASRPWGTQRYTQRPGSLRRLRRTRVTSYSPGGSNPIAQGCQILHSPGEWTQLTPSPGLGVTSLKKFFYRKKEKKKISDTSTV